MVVLTAALVNLTFYVIAVIAVLIFLAGRFCGGGSQAGSAGSEYRRFQLVYLAIYLIATFSDWLQGAYVYALYASYGYTDAQNGQLFVAGFGASMVFGTFAGSLADKTGRRKGAMLYCLLYILSCMSKHVSSYWVLMFGRVTGGIATSLLYSVFDSWLVSEHTSRGFDPPLLGQTFGLAVFANSITAIAAGKVAQFAADALPLSPSPNDQPQVHVGGNLGPFDVSIAALCLCALLLKLLWSENYGDHEIDGKQDAAGALNLKGLQEAAAQTLSEPLLLCCGIVCSFFEASMFIFVFKWTPVVTDPSGPVPPYGDIFATFMVACMLGSQVYSILSNYVSAEKIGIILLILAAGAHASIVASPGVITSFFAFLVIEGCVGMYFPMMGTLKGSIVPEGSRATIYNIYRVPLNLAVCSALLAQLSVTGTFIATTCLLVCAILAQGVLTRIRCKTVLTPNPAETEGIVPDTLGNVQLDLDDA